MNIDWEQTVVAASALLALAVSAVGPIVVWRMLSRRMERHKAQIDDLRVRVDELERREPPRDPVGRTPREPATREPATREPATREPATREPATRRPREPEAAPPWNDSPKEQIPVPVEQPRRTFSGQGATRTGDPAAPNPLRDGWLRETRRIPNYGGLLVSVGVVHFDSHELASAFADDAARADFVRVAGQGLHERLTRCGRYIDQPPQDFYRSWVEPDLLPILDGLAHFQALAAAEGREGNAAASQLADRLGHILYAEVAPACEQLGWFVLQRIVPYETEFDPEQHHAIDGREAWGASNKVLDVRRVGRLDAATRVVTVPAHVVVGR